MIRFIISLYIWLLIIDVVLSYLPQFRHQPWVKNIKKVADFSCAPIRKIMPPDLPFDFSPMVVIILLNFIMWLW
jgi:YggT family protein